MNDQAPTRSLGPKPRLEYHSPDALIVDERYQRSLESRSSQALIARIVDEFYWPYFGIIVATDNADGTFCIIDGQHRAEAARRVDGVHSVPVMVLDELSLTEQAQAVIAINRNRVKLNPLQMHRAAVRAGDENAQRLDAICAEHGVTIPGNVRFAGNRSHGEVYCVDCLAKLLKAEGEAHLGTVLATVMEAFEGNPFDLRTLIFKAVSFAIVGIGADPVDVRRRLAENDAESWEQKARTHAKESGLNSTVALARLLSTKALAQAAE